MSDNVFLDTNVLVYLYSSAEPRKRDVSISILKNHICTTSTQALNEFSNVFIKKYNVSDTELKKYILSISNACYVRLITPKLVYHAIDLNSRYGYSYYDCLMIASALDSNCGILFSEDMKDGQIIEGSIEIINPF
jgi:predicted nucleic acid-binding protein